MSSGNAKIGCEAPDFSTTAVVDGLFVDDFKMSQFKGKNDRAAEFEALNCQLLACSTDSQFSHLAWTNQSRKQGGIGAMNIPLLADTNHAIGKAYGVMVPDAGITYRGLFIIDKEHNIRQITINDLPVGRSVDEIKRLVEAFQFVEEHGEVCPANWSKGADTIKPTVDGSKGYFSKQTEGKAAL